MVTEGPLWEETHKKNQVRQQAYPSFTPIHDDLTCTTTTTTYWYICHNTEPPTTQLLLLQPRNQDTNQRCQQPHNRSHQQQPWPTARQKHQTRHRNPTTQTTTTASEQKIISATSNQPHTDPSLKLPQPKTNPTHQHTRPPTCWAHEAAKEPTSIYSDNTDFKHNNDSFRTNQQTTSTSTQDPTLTFSTQELPLVLRKHINSLLHNSPTTQKPPTINQQQHHTPEQSLPQNTKNHHLQEKTHIHTTFTYTQDTTHHTATQDPKVTGAQTTTPNPQTNLPPPHNQSTQPSHQLSDKNINFPATRKNLRLHHTQLLTTPQSHITFTVWWQPTVQWHSDELGGLILVSTRSA